MTTPHLKLVKPKPRIRNRNGDIVGVVCGHCGHERFPFMKDCPRCEDTALRGLDTSTNDLKLEVWAVALMWLVKLAMIAHIQAVLKEGAV